MCLNKKEQQIKYIYFGEKLIDNTYFKKYIDFKLNEKII